MGIIFLRKHHKDVVNKSVIDYLNGDMQKYSGNVINIRPYAFPYAKLRELDAPECTSVDSGALDSCWNIERISCPKAEKFNLTSVPSSLRYLDVRSMVSGTLGIPKYSGGGSLTGDLEEIYANSLKVAKNIGFLDLPNLKILNLDSLEQYGEVPPSLVSTSYPTIKSDFKGVESIVLPELIIGYDILCGPNTKELSIPKMQIGRVCLEGNMHVKKLVCVDVAWVEVTSNGVTSQEPREKILNLRNSALEELDVASTYLLCDNCASLIMAKNRINASKGNYFSGCTSLERVELPEQLTANLTSFNGCVNLKYVDMPKATNFPALYTYIGTTTRDINYVNNAKDFLGNCESLELFNAPSLTWVPEGIFNNTPNLKYVDLSGATTLERNLFGVDTYLSTISLDSVTKAYPNCLKKMHINYLSLPNIDFGCIECNATEVNIKTEGVASAFYIENCTTVRLDSVTELSSFYFVYWDAAVSKKKQQTKTIYGLNVGAGVEYISAKSLRALKPKTSGGQLGTLLSNAPNLKQANLDALEEASTTSSYGYVSYVQMFYNCPELDAVYLPNYTGGCSATNSFSKCDKLRIVKLGEGAILIGNNSIPYNVLTNTLANLLVPESKYDEYVAAYPSYVDRIMKYS